jgi:N-acylneuraminate cytidylyltransferase
MRTLVVIPARGGSKGIPGKNIKLLAGQPLILYSVEVAKQLFQAQDICVTTDDEKIKATVESSGLHVPFIRPKELATDTSGSYEVIIHALNYFENKGVIYDAIVLLQPTSPFRTSKDIKDCLDLYSSELDMVVSVKESEVNPYYNIFEEDGEGYLKKSKTSSAVRRQDVPSVYVYNGSIYVINVSSLKKYKSLAEFPKIKKYVMDSHKSVDLDTPVDWEFCEFLIQKGIIKL